MKKLLLIILLFLNYLGWSQGNMITINSTVPAHLTVCGDSALFTVSIYNPSPFLISNDTIKITMPAGINYLGGSVTGGTFVSNWSGVLIVWLSNIPTLTSLNITFKAKAQCNAGQGPLQNNIRVNYTANNIHTYNTVSSPIYFAWQPLLTIIPPGTNLSKSANIGDVFTRCITVKNVGLGELKGFTFTDVHAAGIQITSSSVGSLTFPTGLTAKIVLTGADFSTIGDGDNLFENGETIIICETVHVLDCISGSSTIKVFWGCSVNACQAFTTFANVYFPNYVPNLIITPNNGNINAPMNSCIGTGNASPQQLRIINTGLGKAENVSLDIFQSTGGGYNGSVGSNIDLLSLTKQVGIAAAPVLITPTSTQNTNQLNCMPAGVKGKVLITIPEINAGDTVYVKWNSYSCCWNNCAPASGQSYINGWRYKGSYQSICQSNYVIYENWGRVYSQIYGALVPDGSPSTLSNGQTGTFNFLFSNYGNSYPAGPGAHWKFEFTLPTLSCLSNLNIKILSHDGISLWNPSSVTTSGNLVTAVFNGSPPFTLNQAELKLSLSVICGGNCVGNENIFDVSVKSYYIPNNTCGCEVGVSCQSESFNINCPDPCPAGILINNFEMSRTSFGLPDNLNSNGSINTSGGDGLPDATGSLNFSKIKANRAMFGDTITTLFTGIVNLNGSHPSLQYCYAASSMTNGNLLTPIDEELKIFRGGALTYTCTSFTAGINTIGTTVNFEYDLSVPTLIAAGCLPAGYTNQDGDSLIFKSRYKVTVNIGDTPPVNCYSTNKFYSSDIANPTSASDIYQCGHYNGNCTIIGYFFRNWGPDSYNTKSCDNRVIRQDYYLGIGTWAYNSAGANLFPYEYRNWAHVNNLTAVIPPGYTFVSARFNQIRTAGTLLTNTSPWVSLTPVNNNSDTLSFNTESSFPGLIPLGDDDFYGTLEVTIEPTCNVTTGVYQNIKNEITFTPTAFLTGPGSDPTFLSVVDDNIIYDAPVLFVQSPLPSILALTNTASWDIIISNTSNISDALNTWISGPAISGVTIVQVVDLGTGNTISPINTGIYPIDTVKAMATRSFRITATYTSCGQDSIIVYSGWNCTAGYPASESSYPCTPKRIALTLTPLMPALVLNTAGPQGSILLCDTANYKIEGINAQLGTAFNILLTSTLPAGSTLVSGSCQFSYPDTNLFSNISDPILISGNTWRWNISAIDSLIGINGLNGILDSGLNTFNVKFKITTDCGYTSGSSISSIITGDASCGLATGAQPFISPPLDIIGADDPYSTVVKLSTTYVSPCAGNSNIRVVVINHGPTAFGSSDSVAVQLPYGVPFVSGSFIGINNAPVNGIPRQFTLNGIINLVWKLPVGVLSGDSTVFTFEYFGNPPVLSCGIIFFGAQTSSTSVITCISTGNNCITKIITGDTSLAVFTYKAYLSLSNGAITSLPNPPGGETVTVSYDITNTGQAILTDADSIVQFFYDADGNGIYSTGDPFLSEDTLIIPKDSTMRYSTTFNVPAGQVCSIIAFIDPAVNSCVCDASQLLIQSTALISLGVDTTLCSGQTITLSSLPVTGYTYSWAPITGLSDPNISNTLLTTSNVTSSPISTIYTLTTNRMGCTAYDTIKITVSPSPTALIAGSIELCAGSPAPKITFTGGMGTAPYTFKYKINGGADQTVITAGVDTVSIYAPTTAAGKFVYTLISIQDSSPTACFAAKNDSAVIKVNPLPTASISGTAAICRGGTPPNITFTGALGTAPYTFTYTINSGVNQTVTTVIGSSINVPAPTSAAGVFIYDLVSVKDASLTTCADSVSGSAAITVNPLPTATISGTSAVCLNDFTSIIFTGSSGTAPYTFTYRINGGVNQTVSTSGTDTIAAVTVPTSTPTTTVYTLVSVMDASSTICSQLQNGTAAVTVDPLPTATIEGTDTVCQGSAPPNLTFVGYGGVAPYTFIYKINGVTQPALVTIVGDSIAIAAPTTSPGTFIYSLVSVQDANLAACTHPQAGHDTITVNPKPAAAFTSTKVCNGSATQFNDSSKTASGTISSWLWDFGNGSALNTLQSPSYIYPNAGIESVTLLIKNNFGCADTIIKNAQVYYNPTAGFTHFDVCIGDTMHFTNTSVVNPSDSISDYLWVFGDGSANSTVKTPKHYYSSHGTYNVTLVTTTFIGHCSAVANISVKTYDAPHTGFTFSNTCLSDSALFLNTSLDPLMDTIAGWSWNFGDNSPLNASVWNPTHLYPAPGNYQVTLITHSSILGCPAAFKDTITVYHMPTADFESADVCLNQAMHFNDTSSITADTVSSWAWDFGDGSLSTIQDPSHNYTNASTYQVSLIATSVKGCKDTITKSAVVHTLPNVQFNAANVCDGSVVHYTNLSNIAAPDMIQSQVWNFGDNSYLSTIQNASHLYSASGPYSAQLEVVSNFGCSDSITKIIIVNPNPVVGFNGNDTVGCDPFCVNFHDLSTIASGNSSALWLWSFGDGYNSAVPSHCYSNDSVFAPVAYNVALTVISDSGCVGSLSKNNYITVYPKPNADFTVEPNSATIINPVISIKDLSSGSNFWNWNFGDSDTSTSNNPLHHTFSDTGTFTITLITSTHYGCFDTAFQNIIIEPDFAFYIPSSFTPNDDGLNDSFSGKGIFIVKYEMSIFDRWGNLIFFSDDMSRAWDGKARLGNEIAQRDVYVYTIKVTDYRMIEHIYRGVVTLIK